MTTEQQPNEPQATWSEIFQVMPDGWELEGPESLMGVPVDSYNTKAGFKVIVGRDFPPGLEGWHISIGPRGRRKVSDEALEAEVKELLNSLPYPFVFTWKSPKTGAMNYHQDIWKEKGQVREMGGREVRIGY